ncbi:MAG: hypothetical protein ACT6FF_03440, partial [Methanosarcinaceae archaeon]
AKSTTSDSIVLDSWDINKIIKRELLMIQFGFHTIQQVDHHNHRDAIFCEVKWKRLTKDEAEHIVSGLKEKAGKVKDN